MAYMSRPASDPSRHGDRGQSFGGSSLISPERLHRAGEGSCLAVTSPLVISEATGEEISYEDLGGSTSMAARRADRSGVETFADAASPSPISSRFFPRTVVTAEVARVDQGVERDEGIRNIVRPTSGRRTT